MITAFTIILAAISPPGYFPWNVTYVGRPSLDVARDCVLTNVGSNDRSESNERKVDRAFSKCRKPLENADQAIEYSNAAEDAANASVYSIGEIRSNEPYIRQFRDGLRQEALSVLNPDAGKAQTPVGIRHEGSAQ